MKNLIKFISHWVPVILIFSFLIFLTFQPVPSFFYKIYSKADKLVHFLVYLVLGFFLLRALVTAFSGFHVIFVAIPALFLMAFLGTFAETVQYFVPERIVDHHDVIANFLGSIVGITIFIITRIFLPLSKDNVSE